MARPDNGKRAAARTAVGTLALLCQTDPASATTAIQEAMREATENGWDDIRLALIHVQIIEAQTRDPAEPIALIDVLQAEAQRLGMRATEAIALIDRIRGSRLLGVQEPYQAYATARALLADADQPLADRVSGLINLAIEFEMIDLIEVASDTLTHAAKAAAQLDDGRDPLAVIAHNRSFALLRRAMSAVMADDLDRARELFDLHVPLMDAIDGSEVPLSWTSELRANRRVLETLLADGDLDSAEAEALIQPLTARDSELHLVLRCLVPLAEWPTELQDPSIVIAPEHEEQVRFLRLRAYRRAGVLDDRFLAELERYNTVLVARAERARRELEAGVAAMIASELLRAERGELVALAMADPLTGLSNRRAFQSLMQRDEEGATTLVLVDLDDFKTINDTYGHQAGDDVLSRVAAALTEAAGPFDPEVVARIGGDEFALVLSGDRPDAASRLAVGFIERLENADWGVLSVRPSASIGIASGNDRAVVFEQADQNLYERKRNRIAWHRAARPERRPAAGDVVRPSLP